MSRCAMMLPAVARRSPTMTTPPRHAAATIVVACGTCAVMSGALPAACPAGTGTLPGSMPGEHDARNSLNDEVAALINAAGRDAPPSKPDFTRLLPVQGDQPASDQTLLR